MRRFILAAAAVASLAISPALHAAELTFVSYAVAKPVFAKIIPAFKKAYKSQTGEDVTFTESYGPSGAQVRSIVGGLEADIMVTNLSSYFDQLVAAGLVKDDWAKRLPNDASPATSVIAIVTRPGNPKNIKTWTDIIAPGIGIVAINPKTSGNARWGVIAGYAGPVAAGDKAGGEAYVRGLVKNTKTLVNGGREATDAFVKNRIGDVLLTFENEAKFANKVGGQNLPYVAPDTNVRVDFPVVVIDKNIDKHGTRAAAEAFAKFLFSPAAQEIYADNGYRPIDKDVAAKHANDFAKIGKLLTVADLGGWATIDKALFADGALYDQAQADRK